MTDREMLELAAKAAGLTFKYTDGDEKWGPEHVGPFAWLSGCWQPWNPLTDEGDRYRLARSLDLLIDFSDCSVFKRLPNGNAIQEYWGGDCGDDAHAITRAAAEIGKGKQ